MTRTYDDIIDWKWDNVHCKETRSFICEREGECDHRTYGKDCTLSCSEHCKGKDNSCGNVDGTCDQGCDPGYQGALCAQECDNGIYGEDSSLFCSEYCKGEDNSCDNVDGTCDHGCDAGYQGAQCRQAITKGVKVGRAHKNSNSEISKLNVTLIAEAIVVVVVAVARIAGFLVYRYRKSRQPRKYNNLKDNTVMNFSELPSNG
ncbi:multiple epidermal growth factor-like domains 10 [Elysia marginata]|uniref:Multiple epidermal growth factor-like domains 10 n=1 Tax=Elysia marginata TaxID=1093978 RepID=A0AAV4JJK5_9GAST|nr:multiple epidermal growth factor-like domains 10 [Elysia marginata]